MPKLGASSKGGDWLVWSGGEVCPCFCGNVIEVGIAARAIKVFISNKDVSISGCYYISYSCDGGSWICGCEGSKEAEGDWRIVCNDDVIRVYEDGAWCSVGGCCLDEGGVEGEVVGCAYFYESSCAGDGVGEDGAM